MRSLLFVPADSERKLAKALTSDADALILDLEDSIALSAKQNAREGAAAFLAAHASAQSSRLIVRINALDTGLADADLDAVVGHRPYAIMLPKASGGADVQHLSAKIAVREAENNLEDGAIGIIPIATEHAGAVFTLGSYRGSSQRLVGMTWGAEDLAASVGATHNRESSGAFTSPFMLARNMMLFGAAAADVDAIDTVCADFRNPDLMQRECFEALRDGFTGKMAIHPDQVAIINAVFTPSQQAVDEAQRVAAAFAASPDAGVLAIDGKMYDRPHLRSAERLLKRAAAMHIA